MKAVSFFKNINLALVCILALNIVPVQAMVIQEGQAPVQDHQNEPNAQNQNNNQSDINWVTTLLGATAIGGALWRLISYVKPSFDGTRKQELNDRVTEFESRQLVLKQINDDIHLCDEIVKQAQAARDHGNSMHFVVAIWNRAKDLDKISNLTFDDIKMIDTYINNNNAQGIVDYLTNTVKPLLVPKQTEAQKTHDVVRAAKELATKKANESVVRLFKNGLTKDFNWLTSWFGMKLINHEEDEVAPKKQLPLVVEEKKNASPSQAIPAGERKEYEQACKYFSGLSHIDQEARKAMNNNEVKHTQGWLITDMFNATKCAELRNNLTDQEKKRLQESIAQFEGAFEIQDQAARKCAIAQGFNGLKTVLGELKTNAMGAQAKGCIERFNEKLIQNPIPKKVRPKKDRITSQGKEEPRLNTPKKDTPAKPAPGPDAPYEEESKEQPGGLEGIVGSAVQWVKKNPLLGLSLAVLTVVGVMAELRGTWPYNNQEPAPVQEQ